MYLEKIEVVSESVIRVFLFIYYLITKFIKPRIREIHDEEWWMYMNPMGTNYVSFRVLIIFVIINAILFPLTILFLKKRINGTVISALLGYSLAALLNISITNTLKLLVGRPRPDFYFRCYIEGKKLSVCNGDEDEIIEGLKSFPSGHSSMSMAAFGFTSLFLIGQLQLFAKQNSLMETSGNSLLRFKFLEPGRFLGCKVVVCFLHIFIALIVCISRLIDFHHHFDDIAVGALIGLVCAFISYRLYFPSIFNKKSDNPKFEYEIIRSRKNSFKTEMNLAV